MLRFMKAKGQEEIASFFAILMFAAVAAVIFGVLNFTSGNVEQLISSEFKDTDLQEALLTFLRTPDQDGKNMADVMVEMMNKEDAGKNSEDPLLIGFMESTRAYFDYDSKLAWMMAISDASRADEPYYMFSNRELYESRGGYFLPVFYRVGRVPDDLESVSVYIPNPYGNAKNIKVMLFRVPVYEESEFKRVKD